jgi:hypothetical protein
MLGCLWLCPSPNFKQKNSVSVRAAGQRAVLYEKIGALMVGVALSV